jgi:hypothetical protein
MRRRRANKFEICPHKEPGYAYNSVGLLVGVELHCPKTEDSGIQVTGRALEDISARTTSYRSRTEPDTTPPVRAYKGQDKALSHLQQVANKVICDGCTYPSMTPVQISERRLKLAQERKVVAENDRLRWRELETAIQAETEVRDIESRIFGNETPTELPPSGN